MNKKIFVVMMFISGCAKQGTVMDRLPEQVREVRESVPEAPACWSVGSSVSVNDSTRTATFDCNDLAKLKEKAKKVYRILKD